MPRQDFDREAAAFGRQIEHPFGKSKSSAQMTPRTPAIRLAHALAVFQEEANKALAEATDFEASKYDSGLPLGELIRQHREALNMSLSAVAELAGCTKSHVWEIEDGRARNPTVKTVAGLAKALGLSMQMVFYAALKTAGYEAG